MINREKLLKTIEKVQNRKSMHQSIVQTNEINRSDRELLLRTGWLREIMKGWYLLVRPDAPTQDSTVWHAHIWDFLAVYLDKSYNKQYCLSAEASLDLVLSKPITPKQIVVIASKSGSGAPKILPYNTSVLVYSDPKNIPSEKIIIRNLWVMPVALALCKVAAAFFKLSPIEAEIALKSVKTAAELSKIILKYDLKKAGERLVGAYIFLNLPKIAEQLKMQLEKFGMKINPINPFEVKQPLIKNLRPVSPYAARIEALWSKFRQPIIENFLKPPGAPKNLTKYFKHIENLYQQDAYNSLSIEGFQVTPELIDRVKNNEWNPSAYQQDFEQKNALAARGYYQAFQIVKDTMYSMLIKKQNPGEVLENQLQSWYTELFSPSVKAGLIIPSDLIGYRNHRVYIRNSRHIPPPPEAVIDSMETFFECLKNENHPAVRAILGHYIFVFIHPYMDGNGRIARFLMNLMLTSGGYPWVIVPVAKREEYMNSLEIAGVQHDIVVFTEFIKRALLRIS
jgi:hypothetical protein